MKKATTMILNMFPVLEESLNQNQPNAQGLSELTEMEQTFLELARFFEDPEGQNFDIQMIYQTVDNEWLELALDVITLFFSRDTYLLQNPSFSLVTEKDTYLNQSQFADYLSLLFKTTDSDQYICHIFPT